MPKIFVSYRRKSWHFTELLRDKLQTHLDADIFVDLHSVDEDDFEKSILRHLRESDVLLLVITEHTFAERIHEDDDWVRREIREALAHDIPIVLVAVEGRYPPAGLPADIKDIARKQGITFYADYFQAAVERLVDFIVKIGVATHRTAPAPTQQPQPQTAKPTLRKTFNEAMSALGDENYDKAIFLLEDLIQQGYQSRMFDLRQLLGDAQQHQTRAQHRAEALHDYEDVVLLANNRFTWERALAAWAHWQQTYPEWLEALDTENLSEKLKPPEPEITVSEPPAQQTDPITEALRGFSGERNADWTPIIRTFDVAGIALEMCLVPPGSFMMGSEDGHDDEKPVHQQTITQPYWIGLHPVTNAQWAQAVKLSQGKLSVPEWADWYNDSSKADHPVVGVTWYQCRDFCQWLSEDAGDAYALPTEVQWEYAARGPDGLVYPFGATFMPDLVVYRENSNNSTAAVGGRPNGASWVGAQDMAGNVWEWQLNALADYPYAPEDGRENISSNARRVLRGGSWLLNPRDARAAYRHFDDPDDRSGSLGFRVVRPPSP